MNTFLPKNINHLIVPPIKCQGIKTKLVQFIASNILWDGSGRWIEPFLGSGVVLFNIRPKRALVSDTNKHIIRFYKDIQSGKINEIIVKEYLQEHGVKLYQQGKEYYYKLRSNFNEDDGDSLLFLFLNRASFNGLMRFNSKGFFNVPFNHKPERFRKGYITKIVNQVGNIRKAIIENDWEFIVSDWEDTLRLANQNDFVYLDPPYIGRNTDYYNTWDIKDALKLAQKTKMLPGGFALSMWKKNKYRQNQHLFDAWNGLIMREFNHFYHVGPTESLRNKMTEVLAIKPNFAVKSDLLAS